MITSEQIRAARMLLDWNQDQLAQRAELGIATVKRLEAKSGPVSGQADTVWKIQKALEDGGVLFLSGDADFGPGVRLSRPGRWT